MPPEPDRQPTPQREAVPRIAAQLVRSSPGELASLRRCADAGNTARAPQFWRWAAQFGWPEQQEDKWATIVAAMAILTPKGAPNWSQNPPKTSPHQWDRSFGATLCDGGDQNFQDSKSVLLSEARLARLLNSRGPARRTATLRAVRMLASAQAQINCVELAEFILFEDDPEPVRKIARRYYARLDRAEQSTDQSQETV